MSTRLGIDYAWGGPLPAAALKRAGISFVCRYLSYDPSKSLTADEHIRLLRDGMDVHVVWESTAKRALDGYQAGFHDAIEAERQRKWCGIPDTEPIYFAVDFDANGADILSYFRGARSHLGPRTGAYAGYRPIKYLFDAGAIGHGWQTYAWSDGKWDPRARLRQYSNGHTLAGVQVDYDVELIPDKPSGPPYVPSDEHNWIREYDRLTHQKRAPWRQAWLRHQMRHRMQLLRRLAHKTSWDHLNRTRRYHELLRRAGR